MKKHCQAGRQSGSPRKRRLGCQACANGGFDVTLTAIGVFVVAASNTVFGSGIGYSANFKACNCSKKSVWRFSGVVLYDGGGETAPSLLFLHGVEIIDSMRKKTGYNAFPTLDNFLSPAGRLMRLRLTTFRALSSSGQPKTPGPVRPRAAFHDYCGRPCRRS